MKKSEQFNGILYEIDNCQEIFQDMIAKLWTFSRRFLFL